MATTEAIQGSASDLSVQEAVESLAERLRLLQDAVLNSTEADLSDLAGTAAVVEQLAQQTRDAAATVNDHRDVVIDGLSAFQVSLVDESTEAAQAIDTLLQEIDQVFDAAEQDLSQTVSAFEAAVGDVAESMDSFVVGLRAAAKETLFDGLEQSYARRIEQADAEHRDVVAAHAVILEQATEELLELLLQGLSTVRDSLSAAISGAEGQRALTQPALDAVETVLAPLLEQVTRVKDLANDLGVSI